MNKHTQGPWIVAKGNIMPDPVTGNDDSFLGIAKVYEWPGERSDARTEANARLIAAAPELLSALEAMDAAMCDGFDTQAARMAGRKALIAARAAVAKARGEA